MIAKLHIVIPGVPMGKGAARHSKAGFTYTPTKTRNYMAQIKDFAIQQGALPHEYPCSIVIRAYFPIPVSHSKKLQASIRAGQVYYTKKPDTDNLSKIKDALNQVAFKDDAQVFHEHVSKYYSDRPRLELDITYYVSHDPDALGYAP